MSADPKSRQSRQRLEKCWTVELNWDLFLTALSQGCFQLSKALCIPPVAVLGGLVILTSYGMSPATVRIPRTEWSEPVLVWLSINMPTGSNKSALFHYLYNLVTRVRERCGYTSHDAAWLLGDATCEKMGDLMATNGGRLLGLYDELSSFLTQLNLSRGKGLTHSHELALFLQLYNGHSWTPTTVTGEANFSMPTTCLTVGGFSQPSVARGLLEQGTSTETGLCQRFLWLFPRPSYSRFKTLEAADQCFTSNIVELLFKQWIPGRTGSPEQRELTIEVDSKAFTTYFDEVQVQLEALASMDDLLSGMLSKSKGQVLRVAACLHALFHLGIEEAISSVISEEAVTAAINFVGVCCQQTAFMAGRGEIGEEIQIMKASISEQPQPTTPSSSLSTPGYCLKLPGKHLNLTALLYAKKFRSHGYKAGALAAFSELETAGLGTLTTYTTKSGTQYVFVKQDIPDGEEKVGFGKKLLTFGVSLQDYASAIKQEILTPRAKESLKRTSLELPTTPELRRSPRKLPRTPPSTPSD